MIAKPPAHGPNQQFGAKCAGPDGARNAAASAGAATTQRERVAAGVRELGVAGDGRVFE
jgi:hypothetical protein